MKDGHFFVLKGYRHLHFPSAPCFSYMDFAVSFFVCSVSLMRSGISLREGQPDELLKLGRCFWKKASIFLFESSPVQRASGFSLQPPSWLVRILAHLQRQPSSAWSRLGCLWEEGRRAGSPALIVQPSEVTLRGCGHIHGILHPFA